ncbi:GATA transcription factor 27-like isoform X1 [Musa acuminata AAA Group]|uniref:GATA transcription factor 27-like isoform X1 n=1 Tax=Musa acuminata AAA Group TaxID=214697 RepID=UPI0031E2B66D
MGKNGPCHHCGVTSTPLWRNGPPDKPVLCNACGSRWRTKGSLTNYTPLHAREAFDLENLRTFKVESISFKPKEQQLQKKRRSSNPLESLHEMRYSDQNFCKIVEGNTSNRSSTGSAISVSESCAHVGTIDANDMTDSGPAKSNVWESLVPSKKRTSATHPKVSPVEKLTKDLYSIFYEQQSSNLSGSSEEDLIYESGTPLDYTEIGYGGLLIRHPNSEYIEDESEASSHPVDKSYIINERYAGLMSFPLDTKSKGKNFSDSGTHKLKNLTQHMSQETAMRDKTFGEKLKILQDKDSPLLSADLNDIINFDIFMKYLANEEKQLLMTYLPSIDTVRSPESLRTMFRSPQFCETLSDFQQLLQEGTFDLSFSEANVEDCRTLKRLILHDLKRFRWVEYYEKLKIKGRKGKAIGSKFPGIDNLVSIKRPHDSRNQNSSDLKATTKSPKRACKHVVSSSPSNNLHHLESSDTRSKLTNNEDSFEKNECDHFRHRNFQASPLDICSMSVPSRYTADSSDHDLLLNVPSNASFPEAELLHCHPWKEKSSSLAESVVAEIEESSSRFQSSSLRNKPKIH